MTQTCTWEGCSQPANHPQLDVRGREWADLCDEHNREFLSSIHMGGAPGVIRSWIRAQGGPKKAAKEMTK